MRRGALSHAFAWVVVRLRWAIVIAWVVIAILVTVKLPSLEDAGALPATSLVPRDAEALETSARSFELFPFPVGGQTVVVQRDPDGLSPEAQARAIERAVAISTGGDPELEGVEFALPLTNSLGLVPASREDSTTVVTFLGMRPELSLRAQEELAHRFAAKHVSRPDDSLVGITGPVPARLQEWRELVNALPWVTATAITAIALILGIYYRAPLAPAVALAAAGIAYLVSKHVVAWAGPFVGVSVPRDVEPVMVALVLGIVTDYAVFFLTAMRRSLLAGDSRLEAAVHSTTEFLPTVVTAGLVVAAGSAALLAGTLGFFRAIGPGMAATVVLSLLVAITLVPALLAIFGRSLFWPHFSRLADPGRARYAEARAEFWRALTRLAIARPVALVMSVACLVLLALACRGLLEINLGVTAIPGLPAEAEERRAAAAASEGFAPGILSPLVAVIEGGEELPRQGLERLGTALQRQPGFATVIGPGDEAARLVPGLVESERAPAARYILILDKNPHGGPAIDDLERLRERMPSLLEDAGLASARVGFAGDTAFAAETVETIVDDLWRIAVAALLANLVLLAIFLRALIAPVYLLAASGLALAASLGLTTLLFQGVLGYGELTYYVPFAAAVLLLSLGSDYNIFVVGRIWREAARRPLRDAVAVAAPRASGAISVAALALACSFAALAIIPLRTFREFAFVMAVGVLLDAFLVRSVLVPALVSVFGRASWWPARREVAIELGGASTAPTETAGDGLDVDGRPVEAPR
jgi:RND superfamily putative drug exporter